MSAPPPSPPGPVPDDPALASWDEAAVEFELGLLDKVQASAKTWAEGVTALLGVFGSVALAAGPDSIQKTAADWRWLVVALTVAAGVLAFLSILSLVTAQQLPEIHEPGWGGRAYRGWTMDHVQGIRRAVRRGRALGIAAAVAVFLVGAVVLVSAAGEDPPAEQGVPAAAQDAAPRTTAQPAAARGACV